MKRYSRFLELKKIIFNNRLILSDCLFLEYSNKAKKNHFWLEDSKNREKSIKNVLDTRLIRF
jgi:hypothetical protein